MIYWADLVLRYSSPETKRNKSEETPLLHLPKVIFSNPLFLFWNPTCAQYITWTVSPSPFVYHLLGCPCGILILSPSPCLRDFQAYFTSHQSLSLMVCCSGAGSTHDILNVTIKEACKILVFPLAYTCAAASSSRSCNLSLRHGGGVETTSNKWTSYRHMSLQCYAAKERISPPSAGNCLMAHKLNKLLTRHLNRAGLKYSRAPEQNQPPYGDKFAF